MQGKIPEIAKYVESIRIYSAISVLICFFLIILSKGILKKARSIESQASIESIIVLTKIIMFISIGLFFVSVVALMTNELTL